MKLALTPGIKFLLPALITLPASILGLTLFGVPFLLSLVAIPTAISVFLVLRVLRDDFKWRRAAARAGARMPPRVVGSQWGNWDVLKTMLKAWEEGYIGDYMVDQMHALGSLFDMHVLWANLFLTTSPQHIHLMLATDFANFEKGPTLRNSLESVLGQGVFNSDGDMWKFHRSMTRPFFSRDRITHFELFDHHANIAISLMKERFRAGHAIDFQDLMLRFTADSATQFLFGTCVNSLTVPLPYPHNVYRGHSQETQADNAFTQALLQAQDVLILRQRKGWIWPLGEIRGDRTAGPMKVIRNFIEPIIASALEKKLDVDSDKKAREIGDDDTLLDHLVDVTSDPTVIRDETLNILLAARDTTGITLTLVMYFLSMYPAIMARLREEILDKVGPERQPTFADIKDMKFLRAVINETLRLYPLVPFNVRESINATTFPADDPTDKPYYIPPRTSIAYSVFLMHRRTDLWVLTVRLHHTHTQAKASLTPLPASAEEFDPDRFLDERLKKQFAYNEASFMLVRLLQNFSSFSLVEEAFPPSARPPKEWAVCPGRKGIEKFWPKVNLTLYSAGGMWIKGTDVEETSV
ncbi:cytochrome P450 monooxygenase pc-3 [Hymenopellis radicata]|nr:cytochrome P450 monooxygenase pc-3 [Hymenopellis radicata]